MTPHNAKGISKFSRIQKAHRRNCMGNGSLVVRDSRPSNSLQRRKIHGAIWIKQRRFILTFLEMIWQVIESETLNRRIFQVSSSMVHFLSALGSNNKNTEQAVELRFEYHRISDIAKLRIDSRYTNSPEWKYAPKSFWRVKVSNTKRNIFGMVWTIGL